MQWAPGRVGGCGDGVAWANAPCLGNATIDFSSRLSRTRYNNEASRGRLHRQSVCAVDQQVMMVGELEERGREAQEEGN